MWTNRLLKQTHYSKDIVSLESWVSFSLLCILYLPLLWFSLTLIGVIPQNMCTGMNFLILTCLKIYFEVTLIHLMVGCSMAALILNLL